MVVMMTRRGVLPPFTIVQEHTHLPEILALGLDDNAFDGQLTRFLAPEFGHFLSA
jgi:hypothetical protein